MISFKARGRDRRIYLFTFHPDGLTLSGVRMKIIPQGMASYWREVNIGWVSSELRCRAFEYARTQTQEALSEAWWRAQ